MDDTTSDRSARPAPDYSEAPSRADELLDELMPDELDWRQLTLSYPKTALGVALVGGFLLGRNHGAGLLAALTGFAVGEVTRNLQGLVEDFTG
jgi:hypothetical protein